MGSVVEIQIPIVALGFLVLNNEIWVKGAHKGYLLHRLDIATGKLEDAALPISSIYEALKKASEKEEDLAYLTIDEKPDTDKQSSTSLESEERAWTKSGSFHFDVAVGGQKAWIALIRPLAVVVMNVTSGKVQSVVRVQKEDLPGWAHDFPAIFYLCCGDVQELPAGNVYRFRTTDLRVGATE